MKQRTSALLGFLLLPAAAAWAPPAAAQSVIYCCNDAQGRKVCADFLPKECQKRAWEERDGKGYVINKHEAPLTPEQQARRDAELAKKAELAQKQLEERRRNQALLSTYASEADIDRARDRALADVDKSISQAEKALVELQKRQAATNKEKEFYAGKPLPAQLKQQIAALDRDFTAKTDAVEARKKEREKVVADFEDEKRRFRELKAGGGTVGVKPDDKPRREVIVQPPPGAESEATPAPAPAPPPAPPPEAAKG